MQLTSMHTHHAPSTCCHISTWAFKRLAPLPSLDVMILQDVGPQPINNNCQCKTPTSAPLHLTCNLLYSLVSLYCHENPIHCSGTAEAACAPLHLNLDSKSCRPPTSAPLHPTCKLLYSLVSLNCHENHCKISMCTTAPQPR